MNEFLAKGGRLISRRDQEMIRAPHGSRLTGPRALGLPGEGHSKSEDLVETRALRHLAVERSVRHGAWVVQSSADQIVLHAGNVARPAAALDGETVATRTLEGRR